VRGERLAVKTLRPELLDAEPQARERLARELRLASRIAHHNVVRPFELGESDGLPFLTMEYVEGQSLLALLRARGPLDDAATIALGRQLARGLAAAHAEGVVHGDLKPANLLVGTDGVLRVTDFGVAALTRRTPFPGREPAEEALARLALAGAVVGTPEYMAPELLLGGPPDVRADLYAAGMVLHECVAGSTPFVADTPRAFLARKLDPSALRAPRERPASAGPPRTLAELVACLTARDPERRPRSAADLSALLERLG
jgi:serine/threonine-protein kinase